MKRSVLIVVVLIVATGAIVSLSLWVSQRQEREREEDRQTMARINEENRQAEVLEYDEFDSQLLLGAAQTVLGYCRKKADFASGGYPTSVGEDATASDALEVIDAFDARGEDRSVNGYAWEDFMAEVERSLETCPPDERPFSAARRDLYFP